MSGRLVGVGVGPGDPDLMTLKAVKALAMADVIAYFAKAGNPGNGRGIAAAHFRAGVLEEPLLYPVTTEIPRADAAYSEALEAFYAEAAARLGRHLDQGRIVAVISEGDPLLYGSYMHLHVRLASRYPAEVIPGVTGMSGCWAAAGMPIAQGDDILCVLPGTLPEDELERRIRAADAVVIMKLGRNLPKVRRAILAAGRMRRAVYVERGTMVNEAVVPLADKTDGTAPYFSIILIPGCAAWA